MEQIPKPNTNEEKFLHSILTEDLDNLPFPRNNQEIYLEAIAKKTHKESGATKEDVAKINSQLEQIAYNIKKFGAKGDGITNDYRAIQEAINTAHRNGGGIVLFPSGGTYLVNDTIILFDNIILSAYGATIKLGEVYKNLIVNDGYNTLVRNNSITILGGIFDGGATANNNSLTSMRCIFAHIDNLTIRDAKFVSTQGNYAISLGDTKNVFIDNIRFNVAKDGIHLQGLNYKTVIQNIYGDSVGDDLVATTTNDTVYAYVEGEIEDLVIKNIYCNSTQNTRAVLLGCTKFHIKNVLIENVVQYNTIAKGVLVGCGGSTDDVYIENLDIKNIVGTVILVHKHIKDIALENIKGQISLGSEGSTCTINTLIAKNIQGFNMDNTKIYDINLISFDNVFGKIILKEAKNVIINKMYLTTTSDAIVSYGDIDKLTIINSNLITTYTGDDCVFKFKKINYFIIQNCKIISGNTTNSPLLVCSNYILDYKILNSVINTAKIINSNVLSSENVTTNLLIENSEISCNRLGDINDYCNIKLILNNSVITSINNIFYIANNNIINIFGNTISLNKNGIDGTFKACCYSDDFKIDVSKLQRAKGGKCYNTNNTLSCGEGYLICDGINWKSLYSGVTY